MGDEKKATEQQAERKDLEVEEEQAEDVKGGPRYYGTEQQRGRSSPDPQAKR
jgi:hypothetical protein